MTDSDENSIDINAECRWCGKSLYDSSPGEQRVDIYELSHHWGMETMERDTPDGPLLMKEFVGEPFKLLGKFCSAKCLVDYVQERIAPDTSIAEE